MITSSLDCSCSGSLEITSECSAELLHSSKLGNYELVCTTDGNKSVYGHTNTISYLYYHNSEKKWVVSSQIGHLSAFFGIHSLQYCPEDINFDTTQWSVFNGETFENDCSLSISCSNAGVAGYDAITSIYMMTSQKENNKMYLLQQHIAVYSS